VTRDDNKDDDDKDDDDDNNDHHQHHHSCSSMKSMHGQFYWDLDRPSANKKIPWYGFVAQG